MAATSIQLPEMRPLGKLGPGAKVIIFVCCGENHIDVAPCVNQEGLFTRGLGVVQNFGFTE